MNPQDLSQFAHLPIPSGLKLSGLLTASGINLLAPRRLQAAEKQLLLAIGPHATVKFAVLPAFKIRTVTDNGCQLCGQPFAKPQAVCHRCGNCVVCGGYNMDLYSNQCLVCGNHQPGRVDHGGQTYTTRMV